MERTRPPASFTLYVDSTHGSDLNTGLAPYVDAGTPGSPLATVQAALDIVKNDYDLGVRSSAVIVQLAHGTYSSSGKPIAFLSGSFVGQQQSSLVMPSNEEVPVLIRGDVNDPASTVLTSSGAAATVVAMRGAFIAIEGVKITSVSGYDMVAGGGGNIQFGSVILGSAPAGMLRVSHASAMESFADFWVEGSTTNVFEARYFASLFFYNHLHLSGNVFCKHFVFTDRNSEVTFWPGQSSINSNGFSVTGKKFAAEGNSTITTDTGDFNFLPGTGHTLMGGGIYDLVGDGTVLGADSFTGTDGTDLDGRPLPAALSPVSWQQTEGASNTIQGNAAALDGTGPIASTVTAQFPDSDVSITARCKMANLVASSIGIVFRATDALHYWLLTMDASSLHLYKRSGSTWTAVDSRNAQVANGVFHSLRIVTNGPNILGTMSNSTFRVSANDTYNMTAKGHGLRAYNGVGVFEDFQVVRK